MRRKAHRILALLSLMFFIPAAALAHPPSKIEASVEGETVKVTIIHNVKDKTTHYIEEVTLTLNDKELIDKKETTQLDNSKQIEVFEIPGLKAGDTLVIKATCNKFGSKKLKLTVK